MVISPPRRIGLSAINDTPVGQARLACYILKRVQNNLLEAFEIHALLVHANDRADLRAAFENTYEGHGLHTIQATLIYSVASILSRIFDPVDLPNKRGLNRASLPHLMQLLRQSEIRDQFLSAAWFWIPGRFEEKNLEACSVAMDRSINAYDAMLKSDLGTIALPGLKSFRDRWLSHSLFQTPSKGTFLFGHFARVLAELAPIIRGLAFALRGQNIDDDWPSEPPKKAEAFWNVVAIGAAAKKHLDENS